MSNLESDGPKILSLRQRKCQVKVNGIVPYQVAWEHQHLLVQQHIQNPDTEDVLLLLQHPPVYTLGQGSSLEFLKFDPQASNYEIHRIERGGEVTYHCPGQLVGYPILNLRYYQQDLHWYLRQLEEVLIQVLKKYELPATRVPGLTGVWVDGRKVAAIGIKVSRWITMHGFALNICPDLSGFKQIIPCGIVDKPVGSLAEFLPDIEFSQVQQDVIETFGNVFNLEML